MEREVGTNKNVLVLAGYVDSKTCHPIGSRASQWRIVERTWRKMSEELDRWRRQVDNRPGPRVGKIGTLTLILALIALFIIGLAVFLWLIKTLWRMV